MEKPSSLARHPPDTTRRPPPPAPSTPTRPLLDRRVSGRRRRRRYARHFRTAHAYETRVDTPPPGPSPPAVDARGAPRRPGRGRGTGRIISARGPGGAHVCPGVRARASGGSALGTGPPRGGWPAAARPPPALLPPPPPPTPTPIIVVVAPPPPPTNPPDGSLRHPPAPHPSPLRPSRRRLDRSYYVFGGGGDRSPRRPAAPGLLAGGRAGEFVVC